MLPVGAGATAGAAAATGGVLTLSEGVLTAAAGAAAIGAAAAGGVLTFSEGVPTAAAGAAAAAVQCSEIMFSSVTATLLSELAFCPVSFTSWPTCGLRSALLVVILKTWPVLSSATV
jgi:hypothetical protein